VLAVSFRDKTVADCAFSQSNHERPHIVDVISVTHTHTPHQSPEDALRLDLSLLSAAGDADASVYAQRRGNVLLNTSILKCDYFQGCQNPKLPLRVDGAANCRCVLPLILLTLYFALSVCLIVSVLATSPSSKVSMPISHMYVYSNVCDLFLAHFFSAF
jgi:hypothetical protein